MGNRFMDFLSTIVILAIVTTLVLPDRKTDKVITAGGNTFIGAIRAAMGR